MSGSLLCRLSLVLSTLLLLYAPATYPHQHDAGPQIILLSPQDGETVTAPFDLDVRFVASSDAGIDTESLKVQVKKMLLGVDVTEQVRQFADANGIRMTQADFPKGHHTVTLEIADERGRQASKTVTVDVR